MPPAPTGLLRGLPLGAVLLALVTVVVASVAAGVVWGSVSLSPADVAGIIWSRVTGRSGVPGWSAGQEQIVWELRLPRVLMAAAVGATLTTVGVAIQALVRNALADPFILGVSSGASVGAAIVLLFGTFGSFGIFALAVGGFLGALVAVVAVFLVAQEGGRLSPVRLVLAGVSMAFVFEAATSFLVFRADPRAAQTVLFWLLGSFGRSSWRLLLLPTAVLVAGFAYLFARARSLNALALGHDTALTLGVDVARFRRSLFLVASLMVGVVVAASGAIGFVGLVLPHVVRLLVGSDHRRVLPVGALLGGAFMIWGDLLARTLVAPQEMPIGVITAFIGAPVFLVLIRRGAYRFGAAQ